MFPADSFSNKNVMKGVTIMQLTPTCNIILKGGNSNAPHNALDSLAAVVPQTSCVTVVCSSHGHHVRYLVYLLHFFEYKLDYVLNLMSGHFGMITIKALLEQINGFRKWNTGVFLLWNGFEKCWKSNFVTYPTDNHCGWQQNKARTWSFTWVLMLITAFLCVYLCL